MNSHFQSRQTSEINYETEIVKKDVLGTIKSAVKKSIATKKEVKVKSRNILIDCFS